MSEIVDPLKDPKAVNDVVLNISERCMKFIEIELSKTEYSDQVKHLIRARVINYIFTSFFQACISYGNGAVSKFKEELNNSTPPTENEG